MMTSIQGGHKCKKKMTRRNYRKLLKNGVG